MPPGRKEEDDDWDFGDANAPRGAAPRPVKTAASAPNDDWEFGDANEAKESTNAPGVPTDEPPKPMGPPPPPQIESRPTRTPEEPSVLDELGKSYLSYAQGANFNLLDELAGASEWLGGKVGLNPETTYRDAQQRAERGLRGLTDEYAAPHVAGQVARNIAAMPTGASVAANAALGAGMEGLSEYGDSGDLWRAARAGTVGGALAGAGTHLGNLFAKTFAMSPTQALHRELDAIPPQAPPPAEPVGPAPVPEGPPRPQTLPPAAPMPETPIYGPVAEGPRPLDLPGPPAAPPPAPPTPTGPPPPNVPPGAAQDPFHGRLGELARTPPEAPPSLGPSGPAVDPFQGRAGDLARMPAEKPVMDELIGAPKAVTPAAPQKLGPHTWPASLSPQEQQIAETIRQVLPQVARENNGRVFVGRLLDAFPDELRAPVKAALPKLQQTGALKMSRADLVQAFDPDMVARSSVRRGPAPKAGAIDQRPEFHFIDPEALGIKPPPANDLEGLLRQSVEQVQAKGKPSPAGSPAVGARPQPGLELAETPPPAASRKWQPPPEDMPLELAGEVPKRPLPEWAEPPRAPEWSLEPTNEAGAGPRRGELSLNETYRPEYRLGEIEGGAREAAKRGADPRGNASRAPWDEPVPYEVGNPDLTPAPRAELPQNIQQQMLKDTIAVERRKAAQTGGVSVGEKVLDKGLYGLGWVPGIGKYARIGRAGLQAAQAARGAGPEDIVKMIPSASARQSTQMVAYAGAPTLNYAIQAALSDDRNGLSPEDRQKLTSAVVSGDQKQTNAVDWLLSQTNPVYAKLREQKLRDTAEEE